MGQIKGLRKIKLPLIVGKPVECIKPDGSVIKTHPKKIDGIVCKEKGIEVTFTTTNSIYRGLIPMVAPLTEYVIGQEIIPGREVVNTSNGYEKLVELTEIHSDGIWVKTETGIFRGLISLA